MSKFAVFLLVIITGIFGFLYFVPDEFFTVCGRTLKYDIGNFSDDFDITSDEFLIAIQEAEKMWEDATGYDLFEYEAGSSLEINLVYSEQQEKSLDWKSTQKTLSTINKEIQASEESYTQLSAKYQLQLSKYEADLDRHNQKVQYWNSQGGAPQDEYDGLQVTEKNLQTQAVNLETLREEVNDLANKNNELLEIYNAHVDTQNNIFGDVEYDKGIYQNRSIDIYQFDDKLDLRNLLAHELGHALGLEHVEGEDSIMYYLTIEENAHIRTLGVNDITALENECEVVIWE